jgi:Lon protease-like protein
MRRLPLFPLPVVLFPGARMPLHIFEPRYRQMVAHCLEGDRRFGLVYHDPDRAGPFRMSPGRVGCVAHIEEFRPIPDGRSLLLVRGTGRFRLDDGIESDSLYFEGLVDEYPDVPEDPAELAARGRATLRRFRGVLQRVSEAPPALPELDRSAPLSFQVAQWIRIDPVWQQELLDTPAEGDRLDRLDALLETLLDAPE